MYSEFKKLLKNMVSYIIYTLKERSVQFCTYVHAYGFTTISGYSTIQYSCIHQVSPQSQNTLHYSINLYLWYQHHLRVHYSREKLFISGITRFSDYIAVSYRCIPLALPQSQSALWSYEP